MGDLIIEKIFPDYSSLHANSKFLFNWTLNNVLPAFANAGEEHRQRQDMAWADYTRAGVFFFVFRVLWPEKL